MQQNILSRYSAARNLVVNVLHNANRLHPIAVDEIEDSDQNDTVKSQPNSRDGL